MATRRTFLRRGLMGGTLLFAAGGLGLAAWPGEGRFTPRRPLHVLDPGRFNTLAAVAERTVTAEGADPAEIAHRIDEWLHTSAPEVRDDVSRILVLLESALAGLLLDGRARPFTRLDGPGRDAALFAWRDSRFVLRRAGYLVLRKLTHRAHYQSPDTWASVGYAGPPEVAEDP